MHALAYTHRRAAALRADRAVFRGTSRAPVCLARAPAAHCVLALLLASHTGRADEAPLPVRCPSSPRLQASASARECRICGDEDSAGSPLVSPCACKGSIQHAHAACIQRWIDEKGDLVCELCGQRFVGAFTSPPERQAAPPLRGWRSADAAALLELSLRYNSHAAAVEQQRRGSVWVLLMLGAMVSPYEVLCSYFCRVHRA